jgi:hypothetical protein
MKSVILKILVNTIVAIVFLSCGQSSHDQQNLEILSVPNSPADQPGQFDFHQLEQNYFPNAKALQFRGVFPDSESSRYWNYNEANLKIYEWNHRTFPQGVKEIYIAGKNIVLKKGHSSRLLERLENRQDIKRLIIQAESVELAGVLRLPSTSILIVAENLQITAEGKIDVSGLDYLTVPQLYSDGARGLDGGNIQLLAQEVQINTTEPFLKSNGGNGENAGAGQNGVNGVSLPDLGSGSVHQQILKKYCWCNIVSDRAACRQTCENQLIGTHGISSCPTNGENARPGGKPGQGGNPGAISTNFNLPENSVIGSSGNSGKNAGQFLGGQAGYPLQAYHQVYLEGRLIANSACPKTLDGASSQSPDNHTQLTFSSIIKIQTGRKEFADSQSWSYRRLYADDLYMQGYEDEARKEYLAIEMAMAPLKKELTPENDLNLSKVVFQLMQMQGKKDYFGNHPTWIPGISYEVAQQFYRQEMETSYRLLYLSNWLLKEFTSRESQFSALEHLKAEMNDRLIQLKLQQESQLQKFSTLDAQIKNFQKTSSVFELHLNEIQVQIEDEARRNIHHQEKKAKLKRALLGLSALAKAIPAGQPALSGVGTGLETILNMADSERASEAISQLPNLLDSIGQLRKLEESRQDWNKRYYSFNLSDFLSMSGDQRASEIEQAQKFYSPILQTLKNQLTQFQVLQMGQDAVAAEIKRIQDTSPRFMEALKMLSDLNREKQQLQQGLLALQNNMNAIDQERAELFTQANLIQKQLFNLEKGISLELKTLASIMGANARKRLLEYKYYLIKAYQFRLLKPFPGNLDLFSLEEQLKQFISTENSPTVDQQKLEEIFEVFYLDELGKINMGLFEALDQGDLKEEITEVIYSLSPRELQALENNKIVLLNTLEKNLIAPYHQNARLIKVESDIDFELTVPEPVTSGYFDLTINHPGTFLVRNLTENYIFSRPDLGEKGIFSWGSRIEVLSKSATEYQSSPWLWSLFSNIWGNNHAQYDSQKLQGLYVRPGMATELKIKLKRPPGALYSIKLNRLLLKFQYSFRAE